MNQPAAMPDPNLNALWCRIIAEELSRADVRYAVLCPGSRNNPLIFALAAQTEITSFSHVDERSAGFMAIGMARASGKRVAVCVTSGSALANLAPALVEAHAAGISLVVISADRPWEAHQCGAPQTMPQNGIFSHFLRGELALGEPTDSVTALLSLRARVSRLAQIDNGPVHVNVPLRDPLPPLPDAKWVKPSLPVNVDHGRPNGAPFTKWYAAHRSAAESFPWLRPGLRGIIIAGSHGCLSHHVKMFELAKATGWPVIADAASGLRRDEIPNVITTADALLTGRLAVEIPELVIQIGSIPIARPVYEWLGELECPWICVETVGDQDWLNRAWTVIEGEPSAFYTEAANSCAPGDQHWNQRWHEAESIARTKLSQVWTDSSWNEIIAAHCAVNHPGFEFLHLASSMAIRHANLVIMPTKRPIFANRGVNGIDGTLGTFFGECLATNQPGLLLIGDLAFLHDLPALMACSTQGVRGSMVLLNNDGGAIFDYLTVSQVPGYQTWIRTPHGLSFAPTADQFGLHYRLVESAVDLMSALDDAAVSNRMTLIECRIVGSTVDTHRQLLRKLAE